jgi:hypothetical protein
MRHSWAGVLGIVIALAGLTATVCAEHVLPEPPKPKLQTTVNLNVGGLHFGWRSKTQEAQPPAPEPVLSRDRVRLAGTALGALALPLAVASWIRRERAWWGFGICSFAIAAVAWQTFVIVFAVLLLSGALFAFVPTERWSAAE